MQISLWQKHKQTILFNKNLVIADTCSLILSAIFAQFAYPILAENNIADSIFTAIIEYCIDTPIFLILYFVCRRNILDQPDSVIGLKHQCIESKTKQTEHLLGIFASCDIMYVIIKIFVQFQFLNNLGLEPYQAALISSLVGWAVYLFLINLTLKATRVFTKDELIWYYSLILVISIANSLLFFSNLNLRIFIDNIILDISAAGALIASIIVVIKIRSSTMKRTVSRKVFPAILVGLSLWFTAEMTWTYYQIVLGIGNPFPSMADAFWLIGYVFFAYALYTIFGNLIKTGRQATAKLTHREHYFVAALVSIALVVAVIITYLYESLITGIDVVDVQPLGEFLIALAYPIADAILLVPVITIIWSLRRADPLHAHWMLLCSFVILSAIGDIGFGYHEITDPLHAEATVWIWDTFFNSAYICLAAALLWYYKFNLPLFQSLANEEKPGRYD